MEHLHRIGRLRSTGLGLMLPAAFALTVLCFLAATGIAEFRARGIESAATSIATNGSPSIYHLATARTELRHFEVLLDDYAKRVSLGKPTGELVAQMRASREARERQWGAYKELPYYPGEAERWVEITAATAALDAAVERMVETANTDPKSIDDLLDREARPAIERLDIDLMGDIEFNARHVATLASRIASAQKEQRALTAVLDVLSVAFAALAAWALARVLSHYTRLMEARLSDLEMFAGRVAHDIRGPLTAVGLALESTRRKQPAGDGASTMLDRATRSLQRVGQVVDGLLVFAKAGTRPEEGANADVGEVVRGVVEELSPVATDKEIALLLERLDAGTVACSPGVLTSILSNLVGNAIKFIGDGPLGRVRVRVLERGPRIRFEIEDTGPGVPMDLGMRIFDPYLQASSSTIPGLGLGLATVRRLVEAHGGRVGVEPGAEGGSRFWVELPRVVTTGMTLRGEGRAAIPRGATGQRRSA